MKHYYSQSIRRLKFFTYTDLIQPSPTSCTSYTNALPNDTTYTGAFKIGRINVLKPPAKKRTVYVWVCCQCSMSGISIQTENCPGCGVPRCVTCNTFKVQVR
ncbi:hypothetical protein B0O99DRAFT_629203 [Bisporella sp. PMI_857]|nr:hypothetical protein B0O99DRAFT_629203 [Bisporella sp. PMI_857]